jgi:isocitrate dehydrogenase
MGKDWYLKGYSSGMTPEAKETVESTRILFKGPMETPKGSGVHSQKGLVHVCKQARFQIFAWS